MSVVTLQERLIRTADEFPTLDAVVIHRPDLRREHAIELAKAKAIDPEELIRLFPPACPSFNCILAARSRYRVIKTSRPVEAPTQLICYRSHSFILIYGWKCDGSRPNRLLDAYAASAVTLLPNPVDDKDDPPLARWVMHLAHTAPKKQVLDWFYLQGEPWLPAWRPIQEGDTWYAVHLANLIEQSLNAVNNLSSRKPHCMEAIPTPRLTVNLACRTITLDGATYDVPSEQALRWVAVLANAPGQWYSASDLEMVDAELVAPRTSRLCKRLPEPVRNLIDTAPGKGSRLRLA